MKQQLNSILFIDDDEATNFLHTLICKQTGYVKNIITKESAIEALEYLQTKIDDVYPQPDLIFLDINMPIMNGWEFLEAYQKLDKNQQARVIVIMLTTSIAPKDKLIALNSSSVKSFNNKPLTRETLEKIILECFD